MHQYFDYFTLQASGSRLIEREQFDTFISQNGNNPGAYFQQLLSWTLEEFQAEFPDINFDNKLKSQLLTELLLQSLCFLSAATSEHVDGRDNFWGTFPDADESKFKEERDDNTTMLLYSGADQSTFNRFVADLKMSTSSETQQIVTGESETGITEVKTFSYDIPTFETITPKTPLSEYFSIHMISSESSSIPIPGKPHSDPKSTYEEKLRFIYTHSLCLDAVYNIFDSIVDEESIKTSAKYLIKKESKYFFAYLAQSIRGRNPVPYTTDALTGIPFNSLKLFWENTHEAYRYYHEKARTTADMFEQLLFLINSENIFHMTYTEKVFEKYHKKFSVLKEKAVYGFEASLSLIRELQDCPLQTLSCALLDINFDKYFERQNFPDVARPEIYRDKYVPIMEKMTNYFYNILLKSYGCIMSVTGDQDFTYTIMDKNGKEHTIHDMDIPESTEKVLKNMENLKQIILNYLMNDANIDLSWSILENDNAPKIPKVINDVFFNFCVTYALFAPADKFTDLAIMNRSEFDISKYLEYVMGHKRFKSSK